MAVKYVIECDEVGYDTILFANHFITNCSTSSRKNSNIPKQKFLSSNIPFLKKKKEKKKKTTTTSRRKKKQRMNKNEKRILRFTIDYPGRGRWLQVLHGTALIMSIQVRNGNDEHVEPKGTLRCFVYPYVGRHTAAGMSESNAIAVDVTKVADGRYEVNWTPDLGKYLLAVTYNNQMIGHRKPFVVKCRESFGGGCMQWFFSPEASPAAAKRANNDELDLLGDVITRHDRNWCSIL
jgi:hypothetical protein